MSLYDDLDVKPGTAPSNLAGSGWVLASMQKALMQRRQQLPSQRAAAAGAGAAAAAQPTLQPVLNLKGRREVPQVSVSGPLQGEFRFNQRTGRMERAKARSVHDPTLNVGLDDDYDPSYPNDYEEVVTMVRAKRKIQELAENELQKRRAAASPASSANTSLAAGAASSSTTTLTASAGASGPAAAAASGHDSDGSFEGSPTRRHSGSGSDDSDHEEEDKKRRMGRGAYIAPPTSLIEQDSKPALEPSVKQQPQYPFANQQSASQQPSLAAKHNVSSAAAKMMAKMGYRDGQGLGREGQGMASALLVEKTSKRGGKIVSELDRYRNPTTVILLTNMVGPGEVDDELEGEIKDECNKYGPVVMVMIYEIHAPGTVAEEAVRIFVEFERLDSAIKAMNALNGRFFGGRTVACRFYDAERFKDLELDGAPLPLELNE